MTGFLIVDDHPLFGEALGNAIRISHPDARIFEAASIRQALNILATERNIDLALLDLLLPDAVGFSGLLRLRDSHPKLPILILSSVEGKETIRGALDAGGGRVSVQIDIRYRAVGGHRPDLEWVGFRTKGLRGKRRHRANRSRLAQKIKKLTPQQVRVLDLIRNGLQNREIAAELKLAESTVKAHVTEILRKLGLFSRNKAIIEIGTIALPLPARCQSARGERERPS